MTFIKHILESIFRKDSFIQNFTFVASGKMVVAVGSFFFVPILARLFPPEAYGNFVLFDSISTSVATIVLLGYPVGYVIIQEKKDFANLIVFQILCIAVISLLGICIISLLYFIEPELFSTWLLLIYIPIGILVSGMMTILSNWNIREKQFKFSAKLEGIGGTFLRVLNIFIGWVSKGYPYGLILGNIIGKMLVNIINSFRFWKIEHITRKEISSSGIKNALSKYKDYPKFILPNQLIGLFSGQLPIYLLAILFSSEELGYYSMATTLFALPSQLFINAISPVFLQKAKSLYQIGLDEVSTFTKKILRTNLTLLVLPLVLGMVFAREIISFFLGIKWIETAPIVTIMGFYIYFQITIGSIMNVLQVVRKERTMLILNLIESTILLLLIAVGAYSNWSFVYIIALISLAKLLSYLINGYLICKAVNISYIKSIGLFSVLFFATFLFVTFLKFFFLGNSILINEYL